MISTGCGTAVRSPMRSSISCAISISRPGTFCSTRVRMSSITCSMGRREPGLETDEEVSLVGLGEVPAEAGAGAAGIGVDGGIVLDDLFHLPQQPVRLGEGGAGRTAVVEDEAPLVHGRHEPRADADDRPASRRPSRGTTSSRTSRGRASRRCMSRCVAAVEPVGQPPPFLLLGILCRRAGDPPESAPPAR